MLITLALFVLLGTPGTGKPAAQRMASAISAVVPPHFPKTRIGWTLTFQFTPATPIPLLVLPTPMVPATWVPCQLLGCGDGGHPPPHSPVLMASPGSVGSGSRPSPSLAMKVSEIMSKPGTRFGEPTTSGWLGRIPVSITATTTEELPLVTSH